MTCAYMLAGSIAFIHGNTCESHHGWTVLTNPLRAVGLPWAAQPYVLRVLDAMGEDYRACQLQAGSCLKCLFGNARTPSSHMRTGKICELACKIRDKCPTAYIFIYLCNPRTCRVSRQVSPPNQLGPLPCQDSRAHRLQCPQTCEAFAMPMWSATLTCTSISESALVGWSEFWSCTDLETYVSFLCNTHGPYQ